MLLVDDTGTWVGVGLAIATALVALALAAAALAVFARRRAPPRGEVAGLLEEANTRFESLLGDLTQAVERAREEGERWRQLAAIRSTIDLDAVLARTLEAAGALRGVDAAMITVRQPESADSPLVATAGMSAEEATRLRTPELPAGGRRLAAATTFGGGPEQAPDDGDLIRGALAVALHGEDAEAIGTLAVFWRGGNREPGDEEARALEQLAEMAAPAIENALRFRDARQLADLDALTGLHNRRYFHETLAREVARAQRYGRRLALVVFDIDDFKAINDRLGHLAGDAVLAELAQHVHTIVRSADVPCRVGGDEFAVILPESGLADAEQLYRRLQRAAATRRTASADGLRLSAGITELAPGDDAVSFFERADGALYRAKEAGKGRSYASERAT